MGRSVDGGRLRGFDCDGCSIKGIGKATIGALRELALGWGFDRETPVIERDIQYRKQILNQDKSTTP